jgi:hypothetical protein
VFRRGLEVLLVDVSCTAMLASSAAAKPPHLLPFKLCKSVISAAEIGYGPGTYDLASGYLDVKNATITIEEKDSPPRLPASMLTLLKDARHTL